MLPVPLVITAWILIAVAVAVGIYAGLARLLGNGQINSVELIQTVLAIMAAIGAVFLGVYAYRKQRLQEAASIRDDHGQFLTRYNSATEQLANDKAAARLAGVYAMARLADDWSQHRQQCVDVLCAYLRMPPGSDNGDAEVRTTILRVITAHLQSSAQGVSWSDLNFNFDRAELHNVSMRGVMFNGMNVTFRGTKFSGHTTFRGASFNSALTGFEGAVFEGSSLSFERAASGGKFVIFSDVSFNCLNTSFEKTSFTSDTVWFVEATFNSETTTFQESSFGGLLATFQAAEFHSRDTIFRKAIFDCASIAFDDATFTGRTAVFDEATFDSFFNSFQGTTLSKCQMSFDKIKVKTDETLTGLDNAELEHGASIIKDAHPFDG